MAKKPADKNRLARRIGRLERELVAAHLARARRLGQVSRVTPGQGKNVKFFILYLREFEVGALRAAARDLGWRDTDLASLLVCEGLARRRRKMGPWL